jgi:hypothetical protein
MLEAEFGPYVAVYKHDKVEYKLWDRGLVRHQSAGTAILVLHAAYH